VCAACTARARLELTREEPPVTIEPPLGLEEGEKEQPRQPEQGDLAPIRRASARRGPVGEACHHPLERSIEAPCERVSPEDFHPACVRHHVVAVGGGGEGAQRFGVAGNDAATIHGECRDARPRPVGRPRRERQRGAASLAGDDEPEEVRRARGEAGHRGADALA
jgi:hypothetical protein